MKERIIDLDKTVHALCSADAELAPILAGVGFTEIVKPIMLTTVGKVMTIPKGAAMRNIDLQMVIKALEERSYTVVRKSQEERT